MRTEAMREEGTTCCRCGVRLELGETVVPVSFGYGIRRVHPACYLEIVKEGTGKERPKNGKKNGGKV